jgi:hypothetical protein
MSPRELLSPQLRSALFDPPSDPQEIVRHYTFTTDDLALIRERRLPHNRLGCAVQLAYFRYPGRALQIGEAPPPAMLGYISQQLGFSADLFHRYAARENTQREHLLELCMSCRMKSFSRRNLHQMFHAAAQAATGTDRGEVIVQAMIEALRASSILLPVPGILERIGLSARAAARERAYKSLIRDLTPSQHDGLLDLIVGIRGVAKSRLAWLRDWPESPAPVNLLKLIERLHFVRNLGIEPDRERRIHQARYAAIVRESCIVSAQHLSRFDDTRRLASLVAFTREMETVLSDAAVTMFDKLMGLTFRKAEKLHNERGVSRAKVLGTSTRIFVSAGRVLMTAHAARTDIVEAIDKAIGWERFIAAVTEAESVIADMHDDELTEVVERYPTIRRVVLPFLNALRFRSWQADDPRLLTLQRILCCWLMCEERSWSSLRISVSTLTFSITAGFPEAIALISA